MRHRSGTHRAAPCSPPRIPTTCTCPRSCRARNTPAPAFGVGTAPAQPSAAPDPAGGGMDLSMVLSPMVRRRTTGERHRSGYAHRHRAGGSRHTGRRGAGDPVPPQLVQLSNLTHLDLSQNKLKGSIPREFSKLVNLQHLDLSWNKLKGSIPPQLAQLSNLTHLDLSSNSLSGSIPQQLAQLSNLTIIRHVQDALP